ncbi:alginate export family protein [Thiococcus pfennigii]|uniref:alginate export family protein n=1 Tax=Thiococcus pfennigii TaxID=1057 RepID=UPI00190797FD|nr:alginate export family protein [Thiococcus pfennigii]MBK1731556.1 hypothetical protein [Thiococcus pfennigii]
MSSRKMQRAAAGLVVALMATGAAAGAAEGPFSWGGDLRLRQIFIGNVGLNDEAATADRTFQRYRARLWGGYAPSETLSASARLVWEGRHYNKPDAEDWPPIGFETWYSGGLFFDQLSIEVKEIGGVPLALKVGRQDIVLGNGWLVLDGSPIDGSRTIYFDAVRATYAIEALDTSVDLIFIDQSADTDRFPQPLNDEIEDQTEQDERGAILYARNKSLIPGSDLDGYFIYKHDDPNDKNGIIRVNNGAPFPSPSDSGEVYTTGLRAAGKVAPRWQVLAEGAYQWGTRNARDLDAFAFNGRLTYDLEDSRTSRLHVGYEYLSGDDPGSADDEAFDPLWGRWPQWSELMIYQWPLETRVGEATNLHRLNVGWATQVHPTTQVTLDYHALWADEESTRTAAQMANISGEDRFRGHLITGWVKAKLNEHLAAHLVAEYLDPGDFYAANRRDDSYFVRAELSMTW